MALSCSVSQRRSRVWKQKPGSPQRLLEVKQAPPTSAGETGNLKLNAASRCGSDPAWEGGCCCKLQLLWGSNNGRLQRRSSAPSCCSGAPPRPAASKTSSSCSGFSCTTPAQLRRSQHMPACTDPRAREAASAGSRQRKEPLEMEELRVPPRRRDL